MLSYIDVRHQGFFPLGLIVGEAQDLGPRLIKVGSLVLVRDRSVDTIFHDWAEHIPVEQPPVVQVTEQAEADQLILQKPKPKIQVTPWWYAAI